MYPRVSRGATRSRGELLPGLSLRRSPQSNRDDQASGNFYPTNWILTLGALSGDVTLKRFPLLLVFLTACLFGDPVGPSEVDALGLHLSLTIQPDSVRPGDSFSARVSIENPTSNGVTLTSSAGCIAFVGVYTGNDRHEEFEGTNLACTAAITDFVVPPQDSIITVWPIRAGNTVGPAESGTYEFRVDFNVAELPLLERRFVVK